MFGVRRKGGGAEKWGPKVLGGAPKTLCDLPRESLCLWYRLGRNCLRSIQRDMDDIFVGLRAR